MIIKFYRSGSGRIVVVLSAIIETKNNDCQNFGTYSRKITHQKSHCDELITMGKMILTLSSKDP